MSLTRRPAHWRYLKLEQLPREDPSHWFARGFFLSYIDQPGAVEAHRTAPERIVKASIHEMMFHAPVFIGDLVSCCTPEMWVGRMSVSVGDEVVAACGHPGEPEASATEA